MHRQQDSGHQRFRPPLARLPSRQSRAGIGRRDHNSTGPMLYVCTPGVGTARWRSRAGMAPFRRRGRGSGLGGEDAHRRVLLASLSGGSSCCWRSGEAMNPNRVLPPQ
jgi:hypothetical protein